MCLSIFPHIFLSNMICSQPFMFVEAIARSIICLLLNWRKWLSFYLYTLFFLNSFHTSYLLYLRVLGLCTSLGCWWGGGCSYCGCRFACFVSRLLVLLLGQFVTTCPFWCQYLPTGAVHLAWVWAWVPHNKQVHGLPFSNINRGIFYPHQFN